MIQLTLESLVRDGYMEWQGSLKKTYYYYLSPEKLNFDIPEIWELVGNNKIPNLFQFDSVSGMQAIAKIKPKSLMQLIQANSLMRLMAPEGKENPIDTYVRFLKKGRGEWLKEIEEYNVPQEDIVWLEEFLKPYNYVLDTQELIMKIMMNPKITGGNLKDAHGLRKSIAKFWRSI